MGTKTQILAYLIYMYSFQTPKCDWPIFKEKLTVDLHISKALISLGPYNLQLNIVFRSGSIVQLFVFLSSQPTM